MKVIIEKLNHQGKGICFVNNKITFVNNSLPYEEVEIEIIKSYSKYNEAKVIEYYSLSNDRIKPKCKYYDLCGGCHLQHLSYDKQIEFKLNKVKEILKKYANIDENIVNKIYVSKKIYNYRNKLTLNDNSYYEEKSNNKITIDSCLLVSNNINNNIKDIKGKHIYRDYDKDNMFYLNNYKYIVTNEAFFQVNKEQTINMYNNILKTIKSLNKPSVIDLYCGVFSIGIYISKECEKVLGIEINKSAFKCAIKNIKLNNVENLQVINNDASVIKKLDVNNYDTIIVDPPRNGLSKDVINTLLTKEFKNVVYVSCDPMTLSRDLVLLKEKYNIIKINLFDMFPQTYHIESISLLQRKTNDI